MSDAMEEFCVSPPCSPRAQKTVAYASFMCLMSYSPSPAKANEVWVTYSNDARRL